MKYDFDAPVERGGTYSSKWKTSGDELPMWVADMDFKVAPEILEALQKRLTTEFLAIRTCRRSGMRPSARGGAGATTSNFTRAG